MRRIRVGAALAFLLVGTLLAGCGGGGSGGGTANADLADLTVSSGELTPAFTPASTAYDVGPAVLPESVTVTPTAADDRASIEVNGLAVDSGTPSGAIALALGDTVVQVVVTAADGTTQKSYAVTFDRTSARLVALDCTAGTLVPAFMAETHEYAVGPALLPSTTTVTAAAEDPDATVLVDGEIVVSGVASEPIPLPGGQTSITIEVRARDGLTTETWTVLFTRGLAGEQAYVKAWNINVEDGARFGQDVALDNDTLVVGAPSEAGNGPRSGAAYVFVRSGDTWTQQAYLKASNENDDDEFGASVAIDGDTIVVGAQGEDGDGSSQDDNSLRAAGAAYVFVREGSIWRQDAYLKASHVDQDDQFGISVAMAGDTIVVGAQGEDSDGSSPEDDSRLSSGAAYVFVRQAGAWQQQAYLKASNVDQGDFFGAAVAISGDSVAVGAFGERSDGSDPSDDSGIFNGAAYVFHRNGSTWTEQGYLKASNSDWNDFFGLSISISGDTVVVGASREASDGSAPGDNSAPDAGAAYVFVREGTTWQQEAFLKASNAEAGDEFGIEVAVDGDTLVIGAFREDGDGSAAADNSAQDAGAAYVFLRTGTTWTESAYLKASNAEAFDLFGQSVEVMGGRVVVGAQWEDSDGSDPADNTAEQTGAAYLFR